MPCNFDSSRYVKKYAYILHISTSISVFFLCRHTLYCYFTGTLTKMRRNVHSTNDIARSSHEKIVSNEKNMKDVLDMLKEIKDDMRQYNFHMKMDTADVGKYFPLDCDKDLQEFMDRSNNGWQSRMKGFHHLLFTTITKNKRRFGAALLHALFTRNFISSHRWPFPG